MNPELLHAPPPPLPASRSFFVTAVGVMLLPIGAVLALPGIFAILNFMVGGYGSKTFEWTGFLLFIVGPFVLFGTGIGLMLRWQMARYSLLLVLGAVAIGSGVEMMKPPRPQQTFIAPSGVKTTILASEKSSWPVPMMVFALSLGTVFVSRRVREEFR